MKQLLRLNKVSEGYTFVRETDPDLSNATYDSS